MSENTGFKSWAVVEIMGHQTYAGMVSEEIIAGAAFLRIDVPESEARPAYTKFFGASSIYCITPVNEKTAQIALKAYAKSPINEYEFRRVLPAQRPGLATVNREKFFEGDDPWSEDLDDEDEG
jgi:hypothetical protein